MNRITVDGKRFVDEYGKHRIFNGINYTDKKRASGVIKLRCILNKQAGDGNEAV